MGLVKDELGLEVDEAVLNTYKDPKFAATESVLTYRDQRKAKEKELLDAEELKKKKKEEDESKLFGIF